MIGLQSSVAAEAAEVVARPPPTVVPLSLAAEAPKAVAAPSPSQEAAREAAVAVGSPVRQSDDAEAPPWAW